MYIVERLRGIYRAPITDGLGAAGGEEPDNQHEFVRKFETPPIQHEAAAKIEQLRGVLLTVLEACQDVNSPDRKVREEITRTVGKALKEKD